jgi:mRNA-degrading endonuclease RelE of RelBE toxin-antitoxin system
MVNGVESTQEDQEISEGATLSFAVQIMPSALAELKATKAYYRRQIALAIDEQLPHQPMVETRNRKVLDNPPASFEHEPPLWELRVGNFRVFYDVDGAGQTVFIRAIREKPPHAETEDVL